MSHACRLLVHGAQNAALNMGIDQAILESVAANTSAPTLRLYAWKPAAISIGYFQGAQEEVDLEACKAQGVDVVRRVTGGGAVFHQTEITYSFVVPESHPLSRRSVLASYENICVGVIAGLKELGIESSFAPINDIIASGKKISGNAQTRKLGCILQHGTILIDLDVDLMFSLLKVPAEKAKGRLIEDVKERVTSLRSLLARDVSFSEASSALQKGFAEALDLNYEGQSMLSATEQLSAVAIAKNKFANADWTGRR